MNHKTLLFTGWATLVVAASSASSAFAAPTFQAASSGKTFASSAVQCSTDPVDGQRKPMVEAGLLNPKRTATAKVSLNGVFIANVTFAAPAVDVWLADGANSVVVALSKRVADSYAFTVVPGMCDLPDTSGNWFSADGTLEYAASGKSYATVAPGCAMGPSGQPQPYVNLFDNGSFVLNVSINGVPLTQLSASRPHTPVFLAAGLNVISAANGSTTIDYFVRDGGDGRCVLAP